jgi:hypothetical protein
MNPSDEAALRKTIEEEIVRYLSEISAKRANIPRSKDLPLILLILDGAFSPLDELLQQLRELSRLYRLVALASEEFRAKYSPEFLRERCSIELFSADTAPSDFQRELARAEVIIAPVLSCDTIAKSALGLFDSDASRALLHALLAEKRVIAINDFALAEIEQSPAKIAKPAATSLSNLMHNYVERLRQWGIAFIAPRDLFQSVELTIADAAGKDFQGSPPAQPLKRQIVTVEDLQNAKQFGQKQFRIQPNAIVTDEAKDFAAREGISLEYD